MLDNWSIILLMRLGASVRPIDFITAAVCAIALRADLASLIELPSNWNAPDAAPIAAVTPATTPTILPQPAANAFDLRRESSMSRLIACVLSPARFAL
jgi:hypothetical protein